MSTLARLLDAVPPPAAEAEAAARAHLDQLTKPPGSLGRLEEIACRLSALRGGPPAVEQPVVLVLVADHGVGAEGVSAYPRSVTAQMLANFVRGGAAVNVLARAAGARVVVADFGVLGPPPPGPAVIDCRVGAGTANIARGPAMTREQAVRAIEAGAGLAGDAIAGGADLLAVGEMGIGSTTAASALTAALTGRPPREITGRGTGIDAARWAHKVRVVEQALATNRVDPRDGVGVLAALGGFEIGGLAGIMLAAAARRIPVAVDGFITAAAALVAVALAPSAAAVLFASHRSPEPGHGVALAHLGLTPYLDLDMRLGEGTGATLFIHLARAAARIYTEMATFASAGVDGPEGEAR